MDCSFLAGVLASKDASILITALQIAEMLMHKVQDVFAKVFVKEGVVHAIDVLVASEHPKQFPTPTAEKSGDVSEGGGSGAPPPQRPRRGASVRRRPTGSNAPATAEEPGGSAATPVGSPPSTDPEPTFRTLRSGLRATAIGAAKHFKETYFSGDSGLVDAGVTESLRKLKTLCAKLNGEGAVEVKGKGKGKAKIAGTCINEEDLGVLMSEILTELGNEDGVSTFEFVGSGIVSSLLNYFAVGRASIDKLSDPKLIKVRQEALQRFRQFIEVSLPLGSDGKVAALTMLVRKLQNALASLERFPVVLSHTPRSNSGSASIAAGLSALTQPFKLRLSRASSETCLRDYSSKIVLIEPLATLVAIEDFLWPRVKRHDSVVLSSASSTADLTFNSVNPGSNPSIPAPACLERRPSTRSRSAAAGITSGNKEPEGVSMTAVKGKGKAVSRCAGEVADDHLGPETRNAAARRRAADVGVSAPKQAIQGTGAPCESEVGLYFVHSVALMFSGGD